MAGKLGLTAKGAGIMVGRIISNILMRFTQ